MEVAVNSEMAEIGFLDRLELRLHTYEKLPSDPLWKGERCQNHYSDKKLTRAELDRALAIAEKRRLLVQPITTDYGFAPAFDISEVISVSPGVPVELHSVFRFAERQLPDGMSFKDIAVYFMSEKNINLAAFVGIRFTDDVSKYSY